MPDPDVIGRFYLEHLFNTKVIPSIITVMHAYLRQPHDLIHCDIEVRISLRIRVSNTPT